MKKSVRTLALALLATFSAKAETPQSYEAIVINELMASNAGTVMSPAFNFDSWIEFYNPTGQAISLAGMFLSNDVDYLKRWATAQTEMPQDLLGIQYRGTWYETNWPSQARPLNAQGCIIMYSGRTWAEKNYLYPLPSDQLQLNPNLKQNPGWE